MAIEAVFKSWNNPRAKTYREHNKISDSLGTAVNVQSMVFGNMGNTSATGVAFTRNPSTGEKGLYGEYLINAQGEDVVAGIRTPQPITEMKNTLPEVFEEFQKISTAAQRRKAREVPRPARRGGSPVAIWRRQIRVCSSLAGPAARQNLHRRKSSKK